MSHTNASNICLYIPQFLMYRSPVFCPQNVFMSSDYRSRSEWLSGRSRSETAGSNSAGKTDTCLLLSVVCPQVEVSAMGRSLILRSFTDCGVIVRDVETSRIRRPWPASDCCARGTSSQRATIISRYSND